MSMTRARAIEIFLVPLLVSLAPAAVSAQRITGDITGTVTDAAQAVTPGATVTGVCPDTGLTRTTQTDSAGGYSLPDLPVCVYKVRVELQGFKAVTRDVQVAVGSTTKADFSLEVGAREETVTVAGASPIVEFSDKVNSYVDQERIVDLPLSGRDFNSLLGVTPGVQRAPGGGFLAVSIAGARATSNNYMVDGIPNNDRYYGDSVLNQTGVVGVPATLVPMDAISEFTVQQTPSAEFGVKGGAAINVVMKSGTNNLHGSAHYFRHDEWTDSPNFFIKKNGGDTTPIENQQFGGTIGGPIKKDRTFFFGYYEGQRLSVISPYQANVPTLGEIGEARARIAGAGMTTSPIGEALLRYYPTDPSGQIVVEAPSIADMDSFSVKLDHRINSNNMVNGRYFYGNSFQSAPATVGELTPGGDNPSDLFNSVADPTRVNLLGLVWTSTLSPKLILETRFGYSRFSQTIAPNNSVNPDDLGLETGPLDQADFGVPAVYMGYFGYIGGIQGYPITTAPNASSDISSNLTWSKGQHTIKFGGNFQHATTFSVRNRARTGLTINGGGTFDNVDSLVGLLLARFDIASRTFGSTVRHLSQNSIGLYAGDDWKVSPRLTVSLGLRYDLSTALADKDNLTANFIPGEGLVQVGEGVDSLHDIDKNNFGPRAGLAYDLSGDGRTSLRAGYALTYDIPTFGTIHAPNTTFSGLGARAGAFTQPNLDVFSVSLVGAGSFLPDDPRATCIDPRTGVGDYVCAVPGVPIYGPSPSGEPPFNAFSVPSDFQTPKYHYFHVTLQRELFRNNVATVAYVGGRGRDLIMYRDINAPPLGSSGGQTQRPFFNQFPDLGHIIQVTNDSKSWYDSLQLSYRQYGWKGVNTQYNFTLAKCEDFVSSNRGSRTNFPQANNPYDPEDSRGPCDFDVRANFNIGGTYELPNFSNNRLSEGWQVATVFTALSGRPFSPNISSRDRSGQGIGAIRANCSGTIEYDSRDPDNYVTNASSVFSDPPPGTLGTCERNAGRLPGLAQWDFSILKNLRLQNDVRLQFRWEIFNLLNRANFGLLQSTNVRSGIFGTIGSTPDVDAANPVMSQGGARSMQWVLKVLF
jgi:carboxypeptidase family protein/TonB-dependent receptor-like protein